MNPVSTPGPEIVAPAFDPKSAPSERDWLAVLQLQRCSHAVHVVEHVADGRHRLVEHGGRESAVEKPWHAPVLRSWREHRHTEVAFAAEGQPQRNRVVVAAAETFTFHAFHIRTPFAPGRAAPESRSFPDLRAPTPEQRIRSNEPGVTENAGAATTRAPRRARWCGTFRVGGTRGPKRRGAVRVGCPRWRACSVSIGSGSGTPGS